MIEQIKKALNNSTPSPWLNRMAINNEYRVIEGEYQSDCIATMVSTHNAHLIANSPEWLRYLIGEVEELQKALEDISTHVGPFTSTQFFQDSYLVDVKKIAKQALERSKSQ